MIGVIIYLFVIEANNNDNDNEKYTKCIAYITGDKFILP